MKRELLVFTCFYAIFTICVKGQSIKHLPIIQQRRQPNSRFVDNDKDGIDDNVEHALLERFRPYYMFSKDNGEENFNPTDVLWYIERSVGKTRDGVPFTPNSILKSSPEAILNPPEPPSDFYKKGEVIGRLVSEDITVTKSSTKNNYHLSLLGHFFSESNSENNSGIHGNPWQDVRTMNKNAVLNGFYGHVVPVKLVNPYSFSFDSVLNGYNKGNVYYKIEYWQFFAFNSAHKTDNFGDHEGDWCSVQLLYDPRGDSIISVFHFAHGFCFRFNMNEVKSVVYTANRDGQVKELRGVNYNTNLDLVGHNLLDNYPKPTGDMAKAQNNILRLFQDPESKQFVHPMVYIEHSTHEFYPSQYWDFYAAPKHSGDDADHTFLTPTPPNLGEVENLLNETNAAKVVLRYNGYWGAYGHDNTSPMGPALHKEFTWPAQSSIRWLLHNLGF